MENTMIYDILRTSEVEEYSRYMDDVLIKHKEDRTNIDEVLNQFNNITPRLNFTLEHKQDNKINFLDLTISRDITKCSVNIYRKPTTTDVITPRDSCHTIEQKLVAIRYYTSRIHTYDLDPVNKQKDINTVKQIVHNNKYSKSIVRKARNNKPKHQQGCQNSKRATFTYEGRETRLITKLFSNTNIKIAHITNNNLGKLLNARRAVKAESKFDKNGVFQLTCPTRHKKYIGQTDKSFTYGSESITDYKYANNKSKFAQHVLEKDHLFGPINEIMNILHTAKKGGMLDKL
jgi:hypothetical protein